jgi:hypothetical protein
MNATIEVHTERRWEKIGGWTLVHIGYYATPRGKRSCGHQHGSARAALTCAEREAQWHGDE